MWILQNVEETSWRKYILKKAHLETAASETIVVELFCKNTKPLKAFLIFLRKSSIIDDWNDSKYASELHSWCAAQDILK